MCITTSFASGRTLIIIVMILLGAAQPGHAQICDGAQKTRRTAMLHLVKGNLLSALQVVRDAQQESCPTMRTMLAQIYSQLGDYSAADSTAGRFRLRDGVACVQPDSGAEVNDWRKGLQDRLKKARIVILNEAHHRPEHRAFAILLAEHLWSIGFRYLAVEDLTPATPAIQARGWIQYGENGGETTEPIFAQLVERAIELDYRLVNYEWIVNRQPGTGDPANDRERIMAENIIARTLSRDPQARVLVYVGWGHAREDRGRPEHGVKRYMAGWLRELSGIDPLTISQTVCPQIDQEQHNPASPFVILSDPEDRASGFDIVVRGAAPATVDEGRLVWPHWFRSIGRHRIAHDIWLPQEVLQKNAGQLLVIEARLAGRPKQAVPNDRILVENGVPVRDLALRPGAYEVVLDDRAGNTVWRRSVKVTHGGTTSIETDD